MINEAERGAREGGFCGGEFEAEVADDLIVNGRGERMKADSKGVGGVVGNEVGCGMESLADERAGIVEAGHLFASEMGECGFGAISDQLDGVDKVFALGLELTEAVLFGKVSDLEVFGESLALLLEVGDALFGLFDELVKFAVLALDGLHFCRLQILWQWQGGQFAGL